MEGGLRGVVIVLSAFMIQVLALGNYACVGIYLVHLLDEFDNDTVGVSLISAIHYAVLLGSGPLISFLMGLISTRKLCLAGAALTCTGILCMPLFVYLPAMYLFFGVFAGLGGCLIYLPSHVLSGLYYDKYRSLAVGVATAGQGMGAIIMPAVVGLLIEAYTWRGSLLVLAGIDLHLFIFALLMIPPPKDKAAQQALALSEELSEEQSDHREAHNHDMVKPMLEGSQKRDDGCLPNGQYDRVDVKLSRHVSLKDEPTYGNEDAFIQQSNEVDNPVNFRHGGRRRVASASSSTPPRLERKPSKRLSAYLEGKIHRRAIPDDDISNIFIPSCYSWLPPASDMIFENDPKGDDSCTPEQMTPLVHPDTPTQPYNCCSDIVSSKHKKRGVLEEAKEHISVLVNFKFLVYLLSTLLWSVTTTLFITFAPESFVNLGLTETDAAFVITFYGLGQFVGCIVVSILGSLAGKHRIAMFMAANILTGGLMALMPLFETFMTIALSLVGLGVVYGGILGLYMIVMVDLVGVDHMDIGLGYTMLWSGAGCIAGPPIGGAMFNVFGNYELAFYLSGLVTVLAGLVMVLVYLPSKCIQTRKKQQSSV